LPPILTEPTLFSFGGNNKSHIILLWIVSFLFELLTIIPELFKYTASLINIFSSRLLFIIVLGTLFSLIFSKLQLYKLPFFPTAKNSLP
jgi:hypothetical protein